MSQKGCPELDERTRECNTLDTWLNLIQQQGNYLHPMLSNLLDIAKDANDKSDRLPTACPNCKLAQGLKPEGQYQDGEKIMPCPIFIASRADHLENYDFASFAVPLYKFIYYDEAMITRDIRFLID